MQSHDDILDHAGPYARELQSAVDLARKAGELALRYHGKPIEVEHKENDEPVTVADRECSAAIVSGLRAAFPDDIVISEELPDDSARLQSRRVWYVDPIDGTKNFIRGGSSYCIMIGLALDHQPVVGVIYQPNHRSLVFACAGQKSYCLHKGRLRKLVTSMLDEPAAARLSNLRADPPADRSKIESCLGIAPDQPIASIGMKLCTIAIGASDLYVNPATHCSSWDTCAPQVVLEEAGGRISDMNGDPLRYDVPDKLRHERGLMASNGHMHDAALARLSGLFPRRQ